MSDTRPTSNDPAIIAEWQARQERVREERLFREDVRGFIGEQRAVNTAMRADITNLHGALRSHDAEDAARFAAMDQRSITVDQRIGAREISVAKILGIGLGVTGLTGVVALAFWLIERASG